MKLHKTTTLIAAGLMALAGPALAADNMQSDSMMSQDEMGNPMVGGSPMLPEKNIIQNAVNSKDHTTLVAAVKAAGLVKTLEGEGPFTVFAPTNEAFAKLPEGAVDTLLKPENKKMLRKVLLAHVVSGKWSAEDMMEKAKAAKNGMFNFTAVSGDALTAMVKGGHLYIYDESGTAGEVTIPDVYQSNGVIQVVDTVLVPK